MKHLNFDERAEWTSLLDDANKLNGSSRDRGREVVRLLNDAVQAQKLWAPIVQNAILAEGCTQKAKSRLKSVSSALVSIASVDHIRSLAGGIKVRQAGGGTADQQKLFVEMTWTEVDDHVQMLKRQLQELGITIATDEKLLDLRNQFPASTGPGDACQKLGRTIEEYLAS